MRTTNIKKKTVAVVIFYMILFVSLLLRSQSIHATVITASTSTGIVSSELQPLQHWELSIIGKSVIAKLYDSEAIDGTRTLLQIKDLQLREWGTIAGGQSELQLDVGNLSDGVYKISISESRKDDPFGSAYSLATYQLKIENGIILFYFPGGSSENAFYKSISKYDPSDYDEMPDIANKMKHLEEVTNLAKEITAGCNSDEEKVKVIHDWIAKNIAYDYVKLNSGDSTEAKDPDYVFETRHAVCAGYSRLVRVMFGAVGIPCLNIKGYAKDGLTAGVDYVETNHQWNCVYINGKWCIIDITWDSINKYYGESSSSNVTGQTPKYIYYGISPEQFSVNHCSIKVDVLTDSNTEDLSLDKTSATMSVGNKITLIVTTANDKTVTWKSSNKSVATVSNGVVTGKAEGEATITATEKSSGKTATCKVTVIKKATDNNGVPGAKDAYTGVAETIKITSNGTAAVTSVTSNGGNELTVTGSVNQNGTSYAVSRFAVNSFSEVACKRIIIDLKASGNTQRVKIMQRAFKGSAANRLALKISSSAQIRFKIGALSESSIKKILIYGLDKSEFRKVENNLRTSGYDGEIVMK